MDFETLYHVTGRIAEVKGAWLETVKRASFEARAQFLNNAPSFVGVRIRSDVAEIPMRIHRRKGTEERALEAIEGAVRVTLDRRVVREVGSNMQRVDGCVIDTVGRSFNAQQACDLMFRYPTLLEFCATEDTQPKRKKRSKKAKEVKDGNGND